MRSMLLLGLIAGSAASAEQTKPKRTQQTELTTVIDFDETSAKKANDDGDAVPIEQLLKNPVLASGLNSGADAINRSIASLMESLFYNLMDNEFKYNLTSSADISLGLHRDVYLSRDGAWVVVDRFGIGPEYGKEVYRYNDIPVKIGANQRTEVFDIYLRSDPLRVTENNVLPWWRVALNNWFGVLPLLEMILPPSFNANEMYDPLRRLESPFTFPLSKDGFDGMDSGTIKSYSLSGGVNLGIEVADGVHGFKDQITTGTSGLIVSIPLTVFRTGEYRVNVLKRSPHIAWVGLMDSNRMGQRIETKIGQTYYLLSKTIPLWKGLATPVFPVDFSLEEAIGDLFGRVYAFDLRKEEAMRAYLEAVHGNLAPAQIAWLRAHEDKIDTGVTFFYNKKERRFETSIGTGSNIFVLNKGTKRVHSDAEIEITDQTGKYYVLEAKQDQDNEKWDILTGSESTNYSAAADLKVRKVVENDRREGTHPTRFEFLADANPIDVSLSLNIVDKYIEAEDLSEYLKVLAKFTRLTLDNLPAIPIRDSKLQSKRRREAWFISDNDPPDQLHVTPTHLGAFEGYGSIRMSTHDLDVIANQPRERIWADFCRAYQMSKKACQISQSSLFSRNVRRMGGWILSPLKLLNLRWAKADEIDEIEDAVQALKAYQKDHTPEGRKEHLRRLFATEYPLELTRSLLSLADTKLVPRSVVLRTDPKGHGSDEAKDLFKKLNGRRFRSEAPFPPPARYDSTKDVENKFNPANITFSGTKPRMQKVSLYKEESTEAQKIENDDSEIPALATRIYCERMEGSETAKIYIRVEQTGKVQLAKFKLIEEVIEVPLEDNELGFAVGVSNFLVRLTGPKSTLTSLLANEAMRLGGNFKLTLAVSGNGVIWSDEKSLEFKVEDGKLLPP